MANRGIFPKQAGEKMKGGASGLLPLFLPAVANSCPLRVCLLSMLNQRTNASALRHRLAAWTSSVQRRTSATTWLTTSRSSSR